MRRVFFVVLALASWWLAAEPGRAQAPSNSGSQQNQAPKNPSDSNQPKPKSQQDANPFPEDTNSVPVMPNANSPGTPAASPAAADYGNVALPNETDPVRSPDDADSSAGSGSSSSSSSEGMDQLLKPPPDTGKPGKGNKNGADANAPHPEGPKEDESVGSYYLDQKNWKAALSRFESALVLDPENPDVYWGLGEAERHLGNYANAKAHYMKLVEYDPDSKHGKEAKKLLKEPELANAPAVSSNAPAANPQQR
jgi:tetratricopeptide (TPR) repeat protein